MRHLLLLHARPADRDERVRTEAADPAGARRFTQDHATLMRQIGDIDGRHEIVGIRVPADRLPRAIAGTEPRDGWTLAPSNVERAAVVPAAQLEEHVAAGRMLREAREMRRRLVLSPVDCSIPGELAPVARLMWRHIPEAAARLGHRIADDEGGWAQGVLERDIERAVPTLRTMGLQRGTMALGDWVRGEDAPIGRLLDMERSPARPAMMQAQAQGREAA